MLVDSREAERFLYYEAQLMDEHRYEEWVTLWTDDGIYWVPSNRDDYDPNKFVSIIYDDRERIQDRIDRLSSGAAWAQEPRSRMRRLISNVEVEDGGGSEVAVHSNFILIELRRGRQVTYAARQVHRLRPENGSFKIVFKKVMLVNNDEPIHNLSFLL